MKVKKIFVGNWKMNPKTLGEAISLFKNLNTKIKSFSKENEVVICVPFIYLDSLLKLSKTLRSNIKIGAEDLFWGQEGSYTGQISGSMLKNLGVKYVILGHSEKRMIGESGETVSMKIKIALKNNITPVVCLGEKSRDQSLSHFNFIKKQIEETFKGLKKSDLGKIVIAYEPIWAIGKKALREATPEESEEMVIFIKKVLSDMFNVKNISNLKVLYGGSVDIKNSKNFLDNGGVDGLLVGRASLEVEKFSKIIENK